MLWQISGAPSIAESSRRADTQREFIIPKETPYRITKHDHCIVRPHQHGIITPTTTLPHMFFARRLGRSATGGVAGQPSRAADAPRCPRQKPLQREGIRANGNIANMALWTRPTSKWDWQAQFDNVLAGPRRGPQQSYRRRL